MPIVNIDLEWLNRLLGQDFPPDLLSESLEQIGCDVEDVVDVLRSRCSQCGALVEHPLGQDEVKNCGTCGFESEVSFERAGEQECPCFVEDAVSDHQEPHRLPGNRPHEVLV